MPTELANEFRNDLDQIQSALFALAPGRADLPWRAGGWTRKQILGHMIDSAANNRQRFVRAAIDGEYAGPGYKQEEWVAAHGYATQSWERLLNWWKVEHEILAAVVDRIPAERLDARCAVGEDAPVTLHFLITDYLRHQKHHLMQLQAS